MNLCEILDLICAFLCSPLDEMIDALGGPGAVAEMTGRRARMVRLSPGDAPRYETRGGGSTDDVDSLNVREVSQGNCCMTFFRSALLLFGCWWWSGSCGQL